MLSNRFNNKIVEDLPFGVDICLDYSSASIQQDPVRISQLDEQNFKLDFLISAGMGLDIDNYANTPFIQYAIHNEGIGGWAEVWKLNWTKGTGKIWERWTTLISPRSFPAIRTSRMRKSEKDIILVDQTDAFVAPKDADTKDIPNILDEMNAGIVRIWSLDVDQASRSSSPAIRRPQKPLTRPSSS